MKSLQLPISEKAIRELKIGDEVEVSGPMVTGRDAAHKYLVKVDHDAAFAKMARDTALYHCGPVIKTEADGSYRFIAAGPTTSIREEPYEAQVIEHYGIRAVIGKGGMGPRTLAALQKCGAVYLHAIGGLAVVLAQCVTRVQGVYMLEQLGVPEAMWHIEVKNFPSVVTMDSHGGSLHQTMQDQSAELARALMEQGVPGAPSKSLKVAKG
jgi:tartrate/fumarate subfamily iron-sulfur-dependent hydro-lyase beta chain